MQFISITDKGRVRAKNEDNCTVAQIGDFTVLILADGMGGANSGEVASSKAIEAVLESFDPAFMKNLSLADLPHLLNRTIEKTNKLLFNLSTSDVMYNGMGTTLEICIIKDNAAYIAHIGDSRVYKITSSGEILRLTKDHSLVEYMIDSGTLSREEAATHPQKNIITRAVGTAPSIEADIVTHTLSEGDIILVCSDGLTNMVSEADIAKTASCDIPLQDRCQMLVDMANAAGGTDNISVVLTCN